MYLKFANEDNFDGPSQLDITAPVVEYVQQINLPPTLEISTGQMNQRFKVSSVVMWFFQLPSRFCFYVRARKLVRVTVVIFLVLLYCEFIHYYVVLLGCTWPLLSGNSQQETISDIRPLRVMFIGDTHLLGSDAHWFDKLRREWQMARSFQASMLIHSPDVVFVLGDLLDNGKVCSRDEFNYHVQRFYKMFNTPSSTKTEIIVGNHDIGFHYMMTDRKHERFKDAFNAPSIKLVQLRDVIFVLVNSMAMEGDGCNICRQAEEELQSIKWKLKCSKGILEKTAIPPICDVIDSMPYSKPVLLQHFPMYRVSDANCSTPDAAPPGEKEIEFRPKWDCLSKESSDLLFEWLDPRLIVSAHTHHGCYKVHENGIPEYTVASYNWRNKQTPSFLLAEISEDDFVINRCYLPNELTVISIYISGVLIVIFIAILPNKRFTRTNGKELLVTNKSN